jgi:hypothetical protein
MPVTAKLSRQFYERFGDEVGRSGDTRIANRRSVWALTT